MDYTPSFFESSSSDSETDEAFLRAIARDEWETDNTPLRLTGKITKELSVVCPGSRLQGRYIHGFLA